MSNGIDWVFDKNNLLNDELCRLSLECPFPYNLESTESQYFSDKNELVLNFDTPNSIAFMLPTYASEVLTYAEIENLIEHDKMVINCNKTAGTILTTLPVNTVINGNKGHQSITVEFRSAPADHHLNKLSKTCAGSLISVVFNDLTVNDRDLIFLSVDDVSKVTTSVKTIDGKIMAVYTDNTTNSTFSMSMVWDAATSTFKPTATVKLVDKTISVFKLQEEYKKTFPGHGPLPLGIKTKTLGSDIDSKETLLPLANRQ